MQTAIIFIFVALVVASSSDVLKPRRQLQQKRFLLDGSGVTETQLKSGLTAASALADAMAAQNFSGTLGKVVSAVSSYLGVIGPFVGFFLSFFGGPSTEERLLRQIYDHMDNRFDQVDVHFQQLERAVNYVPVKNLLNNLDNSINGAQTAFERMVNAKDKISYNQEKHNYITYFTNHYDNPGANLYKAVMQGTAGSGKVVDQFRIYVESDRRKVQHFCLGILNLLVRASALEISYAQLTGAHDIVQQRDDWHTKFTDIQNKMNGIDRDIERNYKGPASKTAEDFGIAHPYPGMSNGDFATQLYNALNSKYYWREWFVMVSKKATDRRYYAVHACDYESMDRNGRAIAVASVPKGASHHSYTSVFSKLPQKGGLYLQHGTHTRCSGHADTSNKFGVLPVGNGHCGPTYFAAGILCDTQTDTHVKSASGRYHVYHPHTVYTYKGEKAFLFG